MLESASWCFRRPIRALFRPDLGHFAAFGDDLRGNSRPRGVESGDGTLREGDFSAHPEPRIVVVFDTIRPGFFMHQEVCIFG